jgi:hypothetical protein
MFWFDPDLARGAVTGDYVFEDVTITLGGLVGATAPTVLVRTNTLAAGTELTFKNFTLNIPALDYQFYVHPLSTDTVWTFDNAAFNITSINEQVWAQGRQPDTIINVGGN